MTFSNRGNYLIQLGAVFLITLVFVIAFFGVVGYVSPIFGAAVPVGGGGPAPCATDPCPGPPPPPPPVGCSGVGQSCNPAVVGSCCAGLACQSVGPSSFQCTVLDTVAPNISITSPTANRLVSGIEIVQVSVSDNNGVIDRVELFVDGSRYATASASPFSISWNTTSHANGNAVLQARAYDPSGNMGTSANVTVRVQNNPPPPTPGGEVDVFGWAWSSQDPASLPPNTGGGGIGWVALNCYDDPFPLVRCADPWGVKANKTNGVLSGYAWSSNIGWINFGPPPDPVTGRYPEDPQRGGKINWADGTLSGWARSINRGGGWDGWIKLAGTAANGEPYGVKMSLANGKLSGFAWGNDVVGWLNFHPAQTTPRRPGGRIEINPLNP